MTAVEPLSRRIGAPRPAAKIALLDAADETVAAGGTDAGDTVATARRLKLTRFIQTFLSKGEQKRLKSESLVVSIVVLVRN